MRRLDIARRARTSSRQPSRRLRAAAAPADESSEDDSDDDSEDDSDDDSDDDDDSEEDEPLGARAAAAMRKTKTRKSKKPLLRCDVGDIIYSKADKTNGVVRSLREAGEGKHARTFAHVLWYVRAAGDA